MIIDWKTKEKVNCLCRWTIWWEKETPSEWKVKTSAPRHTLNSVFLFLFYSRIDDAIVKLVNALVAVFSKL